jgi:hypothetical protein
MAMKVQGGRMVPSGGMMESEDRRFVVARLQDALQRALVKDWPKDVIDKIRAASAAASNATR